MSFYEERDRYLEGTNEMIHLGEFAFRLPLYLNSHLKGYDCDIPRAHIKA